MTIIRSNWIKPVWMQLAVVTATLATVSCSNVDHSSHGAAALTQTANATATTEHAEMDHSEMDHSETGDVASEGHDHGADAHHHHTPLVVPADQPAPAVTLVVTPDPVNGWNLELQTVNFEFAPERVNGESSFNEGHAHLLVNGEKRGRIYSNWYHLTDLPSGENMIQVTLNGNGHEDLVVEGEIVADTVTITVP